MTILARRIISEPIRSASETWRVMVDLLTPDQAISGRKDLLRVSGIACSIIASEVIKDAPIVVSGGDPRIRLYGLYGEEAINGENADESQLGINPLDGDWSMSLPCPADDLEWVQKALKERSSHITAREAGETIVNDNESSSDGKSVGIDLEAFLKQ
jgi:hypothetical protein